MRMSGADVSVANTAAHTADTPQLLLEHHLKELRLPTILREYDRVARQCAVEQLDYQRYLLRMTELELLDRERRATERRIRQAKFPVVKTMDSFDFLAIPSVNKTLVLELARCEFLARRENVLLLGNSGTGKTHIALALGLAACQRGHRVRFTTTAALVSELIEARDEKKLLRFQEQIASYELLILDELGFVPLSKTGAELLFEMLSQRYERGSTLITSNLPFQEWNRGPRLRTAHRRPARPAHPPRSHPRDERRQLPPQAEPPQTIPFPRTLNSPSPKPPRERRASSATLQSPFSPEIPTISCPAVALFCSATLAWFYSALDSPVCGGTMRVVERLSAAQPLLRSPPQPDRCAA
jgi:DNA replication protein DnaC